MNTVVNGEPQPVTEGTPMVSRELAEAMAETRKVRAVAAELISMFHGISGGYGARTSIGRLRRLAREAGVEPPQPGDPLSAVVADELGKLHVGISDLADRLDASAKATHPSRKSQIEREIVAALRQLTEGK